MQLGQGAALGSGNDRHLSPAPDRGRWMGSPGANSGSQRAELSSTPFPPPHGAVLRGCLGPAPPAGMSPALSQAIQPPGPTGGHRVPAGAQCPAQGRCQDSGQVPHPCPSVLRLGNLWGLWGQRGQDTARGPVPIAAIRSCRSPCHPAVLPRTNIPSLPSTVNIVAGQTVNQPPLFECCWQPRLVQLLFNDPPVVYPAATH